jgi:hypothetical protein
LIEVQSQASASAEPQAVTMQDKPKPERIIICGTSFFARAIEAGLDTIKHVEVIRLNNHLPDMLAKIIGRAPIAVIFEQDNFRSELALTLLRHGLLLVELDPQQSRARVLVGHEVSIAGYADLVQVITEQAF